MTSIIWELSIEAEADVVRCLCPEVPDGVARGSVDPNPDCPNHGSNSEEQS